MSIMAEWNSTDSYATRTTALATYLNTSTVHDNGVADQLQGGGAMDWVFADLSGPNKDRLDGLRTGDTIVGIS
jgi:hypothetical protein